MCFANYFNSTLISSFTIKQEQQFVIHRTNNPKIGNGTT